jgi:hypothetical protein
MEHHRGGRQIHGYLAKPTPRDLAFFQEVILDSYRPTANFMTRLRISRFLDDGNVEILSDQLVRAQGYIYSVESIADRTALLDAVVEHFGMPGDIVRKVVCPSNPCWPRAWVLRGADEARGGIRCQVS